jgi:hypothetical protein
MTGFKQMGEEGLQIARESLEEAKRHNFRLEEQVAEVQRLLAEIRDRLGGVPVVTAVTP